MYVSKIFLYAEKIFKYTEKIFKYGSKSDPILSYLKKLKIIYFIYKFCRLIIILKLILLIKNVFGRTKFCLFGRTLLGRTMEKQFNRIPLQDKSQVFRIIK